MSRTPLLLELDLTEPMVEVLAPDPVGWLQARHRASLPTVLHRLRAAAEDPLVRGLVAKVGGPVGLARAQELRDAVGAFRRSGKPAVAWAETFAEFGDGSAPYVLATGFDEVWLQPSGGVGLTGVAVEVTFLRGALDQLGVQPQIGQRHEYKSAADRLTRREFTDAHREAAGRLAASAYEQIVGAVAEARRLSPDRVTELVDRAPLFAAEALEAGLVDRVGYRDEVYAELRRRLGADVELRYVARYQPPDGLRRRLATAAARVTRRPEEVVALIHGVGAIRPGRSGRSPLLGAAMGSDTVAAALRAAGQDDRVRAVVFRVDSPGGSYVASDTIWREVGRVRAAGKPVVVSMGELAASGGYFVSMGADVIVAEPGTLTGSIGVFAGKAVLSGLLGRLGLDTGAVAEGAHARIMSSRQPFTGDEWQRINLWLDRVYEDFVEKAAAGRGMTRDELHDVAKGRVWTGADARARRLVDELGGLPDAADIARRRAGLAASAELRRWPALTPVDRIRPPRSSESPAAAAVSHLGGWGGLAALAARLGLPADGPLVMPPLRLT